jgi:hypothetical protein
MKRYIFRDNANGGRIVLACDAESDADAAKRCGYYFGPISLERVS